MIWLALAVSGALGAIVRYSIIQWLEKTNAPFYRATLIVNMLGSFFIGLAGHLTDHQWAFVITVGFLGALTTFSTFAFDALRLMKAGQTKRAIRYILSTLIISFVCIVVGYKII